MCIERGWWIHETGWPLAPLASVSATGGSGRRVASLESSSDFTVAVPNCSISPVCDLQCYAAGPISPFHNRHCCDTEAGAAPIKGSDIAAVTHKCDREEKKEAALS